MPAHSLSAFVGDHPALDFLNTLSTPSGEATEQIGDGRSLVDWMASAKLLEEGLTTRFRRDAEAGGLDGVAEQARHFRERLRSFVRLHMGRPLDGKALAGLGFLNDLLARGEGHLVVLDRAGGGLACVKRHRFDSPESLLQPIAEAAADLVCEVDFRLVRACEGPACTLMFVDLTKSHARRWCSMAVCGNRAKAAAHRARSRKS